MKRATREDSSGEVGRLDFVLRGLRRHPRAAELTERRLGRFAEVACRRLQSVTVVLENLWDSHNTSAVVRSAEGLGLDAVHVVEEPNRYKRHPSILHGADRWLRIERRATLDECLRQLRREGFRVAAADVGSRCVPVEELPVDRPLAIVLGTEKAGLTVAARSLADLRFTVPMMGFTGSFNVSVSAAVALYDLTSRRRRHLGSVGDLDEAAAMERAVSWLERSRGQH